MPVHDIQVRFKFENRLDSGFRRNDKNKSRRLARAAASTYPITRCRDTKRNRNDPISAIGIIPST